MNIRAALHSLAVIATGIATGTITLSGIDDATTKIIVMVAGLIAMGINAYMGMTTSGAAKAPEETHAP